MTAPLERSPERDAALEALVATRPFAGWSVTALREAAGTDADLLFAGGQRELVEAWTDLADRQMAAAVAAWDLSGSRTPARVRAIIAERLRQAEPHREAVRRAAAVLAAAPVVAARCTARTADAIWRAAGDDSVGLSHHTKRATLGVVYGATLLFWLGRRGEDEAATLGFLDRRLAEVGRIGRLRARLRFGRRG